MRARKNNCMHVARDAGQRKKKWRCFGIFVYAYACRMAFFIHNLISTVWSDNYMWAYSSTKYRNGSSTLDAGVWMNGALLFIIIVNLSEFILIQLKQYGIPAIVMTIKCQIRIIWCIWVPDADFIASELLMWEEISMELDKWDRNGVKKLRFTVDYHTLGPRAFIIIILLMKLTMNIERRNTWYDLPSQLNSTNWFILHVKEIVRTFSK